MFFLYIHTYDKSLIYQLGTVKVVTITDNKIENYNNIL